ncbi:MAG: SDR family oxidoreductase [Gammaproteobacteria bacterium]|nr:SDR family oxidoreductase [Gammaproteobacteria bacterium]
MELGISGRVALVTGSSQGIGFGVAQALAAEGAYVILNGRDSDRLAQARSLLGHAACSVIAGDLSQAEQVPQVIEKASGIRGRIDILINNAGSTPAGRIEDVSDEDWYRSIDLKLLGYVRCMRALLPAMRSQKWGRIVNIIGSAGYQPRATYIAGSAINAALLSLTKGLASEAAADNVLINGISPGPIRTQRWLDQIAHRARLEGTTKEKLEARASQITPVGRVGKPEDIAGLTVFLCSERASFITGGLFDVDGGGRVGI